MNTKPFFASLLIAVVALFVSYPAAQGYPPAPDGVIYGLVKDQYGQPLANPADQVILQTPSGVQVVANIQPNLAIGVNYAVQVPMDAGSISPPYVSNALTVGTQYKLYVVVGATTNLPLEMTGPYSILAAPSQRTVQNLNLGSDANGDGIPDAWETAFLASLGLNLALSNINANADYPHDGHSLRQEFLLGNYPYRTNAFSVSVVSLNAGSAVLAFTTAAGRTYTATGSPDLVNWAPLSFAIPAVGTNLQTSFYSTSIQTLQIQTVQPPSVPQFQFFRLQFQ
jgi:hypothetical protein